MCNHDETRLGKCWIDILGSRELLHKLESNGNLWYLNKGRDIGKLRTSQPLALLRDYGRFHHLTGERLSPETYYLITGIDPDARNSAYVLKVSVTWDKKNENVIGIEAAEEGVDAGWWIIGELAMLRGQVVRIPVDFDQEKLMEDYFIEWDGTYPNRVAA